MRPDRRERVRRSASALGPNAPKVEVISILGSVGRSYLCLFWSQEDQKIKMSICP